MGQAQFDDPEAQSVRQFFADRATRAPTNILPLRDRNDPMYGKMNPIVSPEDLQQVAKAHVLAKNGNSTNAALNSQVSAMRSDPSVMQQVLTSIMPRLRDTAPDLFARIQGSMQNDNEEGTGDAPGVVDEAESSSAEGVPTFPQAQTQASPGSELPRSNDTTDSTSQSGGSALVPLLLALVGGGGIGAALRSIMTKSSATQPGGGGRLAQQADFMPTEEQAYDMRRSNARTQSAQPQRGGKESVQSSKPDKPKNQRGKTKPVKQEQKARPARDIKPGSERAKIIEQLAKLRGRR